MKFDMTCSMMGKVLAGMVKSDIPDAAVRSKIQTAYREIVCRAKDIGSKNNLISSYLLAAFFIAMNRSTGLTPQENFEILEKGMRKSKLLKMFMGDSRGYFSEKHMQKRRRWSQDTYERKYENDWLVDVIEGTEDFTFGFDYRECGVCKLCRDEGCPDLAKYLCRLDFMLVELIGIHLERTMTLAEGCEKCDFRFSEQK